jgi:hypothetical protein
MPGEENADGTGLADQGACDPHRAMAPGRSLDDAGRVKRRRDGDGDAGAA